MIQCSVCGYCDNDYNATKCKCGAIFHPPFIKEDGLVTSILNWLCPTRKLKNANEKKPVHAYATIAPSVKKRVYSSSSSDSTEKSKSSNRRDYCNNSSSDGFIAGAVVGAVGISLLD